MATCYRCGNWKPDFGNCTTCENRKIEEQQHREILDSNREIADSFDRAANTQAKIAALQAVYQAEQTEKLVELEKKKLAEQKKQTQILLEQTLTEEEVFQRGFNFQTENDEHHDAMKIDINTGEDLTPDHLNYVAVDLGEQGDFILNFDNPYVGQKYKKAYKDGIQKRIEQEYPEPPGFDYMRDHAFDNGYAKSEYPSIIYPEVVNKQVTYIERNGSKYAFILGFQKNPNFTEIIQEHTGSLSYTWTPPYETELLNLSFEAGINKFLEEQNTPDKKIQRLSLVTKQIEDDKRKTEIESKELQKKQNQETIKNIFSSTAIGAFTGGLLSLLFCVVAWFFILIFADSFWEFLKKIMFYGVGIGAGIGFLKALLDTSNEGKNVKIYSIFLVLLISVLYFTKDHFNKDSIKFIDLNSKKNNTTNNTQDINKKSTIHDKNNKIEPSKDTGSSSESKVESVPPISDGVKNIIQIPISKLVVLNSPDVDPYYPTFSKRAGEEGEVVVRLIVNEAGLVEEVGLLNSSSYPRLDRAALVIGKLVVFKPYVVDGNPSKISTNLLIKFKLKNEDDL
jgi:TonB family protein